MKTTHLIIALNVIVYGAMLALVGAAGLHEFSTPTLLEFGGLYAPLVREGQVWRMMTAVFIHITPWHIAMNMVALYQVGILLESHYGRWRYTVLYLIAGLGGSVVSLAWNWVHPVTSAGASGAICGLIGAGAVTGHLVGGPQGKKIRDTMIQWAVIVLVFGWLVHADNAAHAGGFLAGAAVAWLYDRKAGWMRRRRDAGTGPGWEAALLILVVGASFGLAAKYQKSAVSVEDLVNGAVDLARAGKTDEAIARYRRAIQMEPKNEIAHYDLGLALLRKKQFAAAEAELRAAIAIDPSRKESWDVLTQALLLQGKQAEAVKAHQKYIELGGKDTE